MREKTVEGRKLFLIGIFVLPGCTQPVALVPVDVAEAQCVGVVLNGGSESSVSIGVGTGGGVGFGGLGWDDDWDGCTGVAVSTTIPVNTSDPEAAYNSCVLRKAGQAPDTPLAQRPEIKG